MPYKSEQKGILIPRNLKRNVKLTLQQVNEIQELYATGFYSWNQLAKKYHVSKSRIGQIVNPKIAERNRQYAKEHKFPESEKKRAQYMKEHRKYKHSLYKQGLLLK